MQNRLALLSLFLGGVLFGTASCGEDEPIGGTQNDGHVGYCEPCDAASDCQSGNVCRASTPGATLGVCAKSTDTQCCTNGTTGTCHTGLNSNVGSGGSAGGGIIGSGGKAGSGGSGGSGGSAAKTHLGQACVSDGDCVTDGLKCITDTSLTGQQGPAGGLCTLPCESNGDCLDFASSAYCYTLGTEQYCVEGCPIGDAIKCHERDNVACTPLTNQAECTSDSQCGPDGVCDTDSAICVFGGCVPTCLADSDCGAGLSCDFSTGLCAKNPKEGAAIGAPCDPADANDPCAGFCVRVSDTEGMCSAGCSQNQNLYGCGFDGNDPAAALCAFVSVSAFNSLGDQGLCGALCDCNDDCKISGWGCLDIDEQLGSGAADYFQRAGICLQLDSGTKPTDTLQTCPPGSSGGSGGEGGGPSATGGSAGKGGTGGTGSSGEGGEPATNAGGGGQSGNP
jgi:hypothetical protein